MTPPPSAAPFAWALFISWPGALSPPTKPLFLKSAGFFCCRCGTDDTRSLLAPQIGSGLAGHAAQVTALGGELDLSKQKGLDRLIVKMVSGQNNAMRPDGVSPERVAAFVEALMEAASGV